MLCCKQADTNEIGKVGIGSRMEWTSSLLELWDCEGVEDGVRGHHVGRKVLTW